MAHPAVARAATSVKPKRVLFARIGWMTYYAGPQPGDERPKGGGAYNKQHVGHELFNFTNFNGRLYGIARAKNGKIDLTKIDPNANATGRLDDVLVIFVARQLIIGWYRDATVYGLTKQQLPQTVKADMKQRVHRAHTKGFKLEGYRFEGAVEKATLLPTYERLHPVPGHVKGGFGQSNICYPYLSRGRSKHSEWMKKAVEYVLTYDKANLLIEPDAEAISEEAIAVAEERAGGFQSDTIIRKAVEAQAMTLAKSALKNRGYGAFHNTSALHPYDYICQKAGMRYYVEVKGTQTLGKSVVLTKGEVDHARAHPGACIFVLVHSVRVTAKKTAYHGTAVVKENWQPRLKDLKAIQYVWTFS